MKKKSALAQKIRSKTRHQELKQSY